MNILYLGDIVGRIGRKAVAGLLPQLKQTYSIDFTIANSENATHGHGLSHIHYNELLEVGIDAFTSGNHFLRHKDVFNTTFDFSKQVRPYNFNNKTPLEGTRVFKVKDKTLRLTNLLGRVYLDTVTSNAFDDLKNIIETEEKTDIHIVDFHAEATGEKISLARAFDGQVTAIVGTHTHVQTADERLLSKGTAYITDLGMCGAYESILGDSPEPVIKRTWTGMPAQFTIPESGTIQVCGAVISIDDKTNKATSIKRIFVIK